MILSTSPLTETLALLDQTDHLDLDDLKNKLQSLSSHWITLENRIELYESEFRRELKAKIDLCGGVANCPDAATAEKLSGEELLKARRTVSLNFNRLFCIAPLTRNARKPTSRTTAKVYPDTLRVHAR
jgi:hypothetical protein